MKNIFKNSVALFILLISLGFLSGCGKYEEVNVVEKGAGVEVVESEKEEKQIIDKQDDGVERKSYKFAGIKIDYPEGWYYNYVDMPGGGFISNKMYEYNTEPKLSDDEVRIYVGGAPYDV